MRNRRPKNWLRTLTFGVMSALMALAPLANVPFANAASGSTIVWTGAGDGTKFSDGANWQGGVAPVAGDIVEFPALAKGPNATDPSGSGYWTQEIDLTNDTNVSLGGVIVENDTTQDSNIAYSTTYKLDTLTLQDGATMSQVNSSSYYEGASLAFDTGAVVTSTGTINLDSFNLDAKVSAASIGTTGTGTSYATLLDGSSVSGSISGNISLNMNPKTVQVGSITILADDLVTYEGPSATISTNMTLSGSVTGNKYGQVGFGSCAVAGHAMGITVSPYCTTYNTETYTLTGNITLKNDVYFSVPQNTTVKVTGTVTTNGHKLLLSPDSKGTLTVGTTAVKVVAVTTTYSDDKPSQYVDVTNKETAILDGTRGSVTVEGGGILKGNGTASSLYVSGGGTVAPGHSPGTITVLDQLDLESGSTYQAQIQNATSYDKLIVGKNSTSGTAVTLNNAILQVSLYGHYNILKGNKFTIINNESNGAVSGTFKGLNEGTHIVVDGVVFSISYKGGTGNDVVLTALTSKTGVAVPDTGVATLTFANPLVVMTLGLASAGVLLFLAKRSKANR